MPPKTFLPITLTYMEIENLTGQFTPTIQVSPDPAIQEASTDPGGTPPKSPFTGVLFITDDQGQDLYWVIEEKAGQHPKRIEIFLNDNSAQWTLPGPIRNSHWKYKVQVWDGDPSSPTSNMLAEKDPEIHWGRKG